MLALQSLLPAARTGGITVLSYHAVRPTEAPFNVHTVTPDAFERHMAFLASNYEIIALDDAPAALASPDDGVRRVVVTFDDAYRDIVEYAYPVLEQYGITATVFVPTGFVGEPTVMTVNQMRDMRAGGLVRFGSHTVTHPDMRRLDRGELWYETLVSRRVLEQWLGESVTTFAYPFGQRHNLSRAAAQAVVEAGYTIAVTACWGTRNRPDRPLELHRIFLDTADNPAALEAKLEGSGDWRTWKAAAGYAARRITGQLRNAAAAGLLTTVVSDLSVLVG